MYFLFFIYFSWWWFRCHSHARHGTGAYGPAPPCPWGTSRTSSPFTWVWHFFSHLDWKLYERHWISNEKSCAVCSSVNDRCGEWRGRRTQDQRATVGSFAEIFGRLLCVGLFALLGQFPEAHQPFCLRRIHWTLYHVVHRGQHALHGTWSPRHERGDESRPQNGKLCNHSITILAWHWKWFSSIIIWKLVLHGHIRHWSHIQIDCHQPEILF